MREESVKTAAGTRESKSLFRHFELKATDDAARTFSGLAAAFSLDQGGDVILPGAFKRTLKDWRAAKGKVLPLIDAHNYGSVRAVVGKMTEAAETDEGLDTTFAVIDGPDGDEVYRRVKGGYVDGLSIGYQAIETRMPNEEEQRGGIWRFVKELKLLEVSVVIWPMNADARVDAASVKQMMDSLAGAPLAVLEEAAQEVRALIAASEPKASPVVGLALEDPRIVALEERMRILKLRSLGLVA